MPGPAPPRDVLPAMRITHGYHDVRPDQPALAGCPVVPASS